jgi:hypothetical protein
MLLSQMTKPVARRKVRHAALWQQHNGWREGQDIAAFISELSPGDCHQRRLPGKPSASSDVASGVSEVKRRQRKAASIGGSDGLLLQRPSIRNNRFFAN